MMMKVVFTAAALLFANGSLAQDMSGHGNHSNMSMGQPEAAQSPSNKAFIAANAKMHANMEIELSGNADVDFVRGMIPHHQGAIDMARVELEFGKNPEIRKLAEEVIKAQEGEIAMMREWLAKNAK